MNRAKKSNYPTPKEQHAMREEHIAEMHEDAADFERSHQPRTAAMPEEGDLFECGFQAGLDLDFPADNQVFICDRKNQRITYKKQPGNDKVMEVTLLGEDRKPQKVLIKSYSIPELLKLGKKHDKPFKFRYSLQRQKKLSTDGKPMQLYMPEFIEYC